MSEDNETRDESERGERASDRDLGDRIPVEIEEGSISKHRDRIGEEADRAVEQFDERLIDLLSWVLDTETRARIYVFLRQHPGSTSEEIAEGTGLYPSTVREALAALHSEQKVTREKRESAGAGNNPYEYTAIAPSELVGGIVGQIQDELNTVFNLDSHLQSGDETEAETEPVSIRVDEDDADADDGGVDDAGIDSGVDETDATDEDA